ncbi:MAG: 50S ribosomal protein L4 [Muribaculaceae bacterium]|jgi:large subunit ribosomal protein L4|uniref:50S ribosomal protein L4 n=1 Tax=Bacteroidales TaxID=171549 RepID=UPI000E7EA425|nr:MULTISPECIES: 50S ribosomal protein L4 [Bacteroidales]MBJ2193669.1 50S ribosomal protein L4 [Muribaculaceae bacterium]ROS83611.1 50S ribosomal protein L4 [Muribaculaceae bacterium Isolate-036 (Harlan)]ROT21768.1 50S ribosomal protein L4 [Muribaculaceae bacterium Isolate-114 (HZI)]ROT23552.1 50S ribosomal protein L4 [Muribaculaceae bacterium Isolate-113 (HZI)]RXE67715.1 50S ribosomal protein L4 [Muribaculaceae bacterium Isolate-001 (NCI)]HBY16675.1 50S ribosomal protein L4 [Porphyromonadace
MEVAVYNIKGEDTGRKVTLNDEVFSRDLSEGNAEHTIYLDIKQYLGNQRQGTHKSKERSEVSGSTRKLGRQKGGGGARRGDINSPLLRGGGTVFGPRPRDYRTKLNKKVKALARRIALTSSVNDKKIFVIENFSFDAPKTKSYMNIAKGFKLEDKKVLLVMAGVDENVLLSVRNVPNALMAQAVDLNAFTLLNTDAILVTEDSVAILNEF